MEEQLRVTIDRPLTRFEEFIFKKSGGNLLPNLVPGSSRGTMLEEDPDVDIVKSNPTRLNWYLFLTKKGFKDCGDHIINVANNDWSIRYALARTFTGINVNYELKVTAEMFSDDSFMCFPEAMRHILKHGSLDCTVNWSQTDHLDLWAVLDYPDHYPGRDLKNMSVFIWYGQLDRNGVLRGKLELRKSDKEKY